MQQNICSDENEMIECMGYMYSPWRRFCHQELPHHLSSAVLLCGLAFSLGSQFLPSSLQLWSITICIQPALPFGPRKDCWSPMGIFSIGPLYFIFWIVKGPLNLKLYFLSFSFLFLFFLGGQIWPSTDPIKSLLWTCERENITNVT